MPYCVTYVPGMPCNLCLGKLKGFLSLPTEPQAQTRRRWHFGCRLEFQNCADRQKELAHADTDPPPRRNHRPCTPAGERIEVTFVGEKDNEVPLGIEAPADMTIHQVQPSGVAAIMAQQGN